MSEKIKAYTMVASSGAKGVAGDVDTLLEIVREALEQSKAGESFTVTTREMTEEEFAELIESDVWK